MNFQSGEHPINQDVPPFLPVKDLQAGFTDNQWYCHLARQTVYFSAYSREDFTRQRAIELARNITTLAPHLLSSFKRDEPGAPLSDAVLQEIISIEQVDDLSVYPNKWSMIGQDIFERADLPLFRIRVAALEDGKDPQGNAAMILVLSTHSLFEGADAVKLSRSQPVTRGPVTTRAPAGSRLKRLSYRVMAAVLAPLQLLAAHLIAPKVADIGYKSMVFERAKIRRVAAELDIRQQSLMFALATFALNDGGAGFSKKSISTIYADLSRNEDFQTNDDYFSFRMIDLKLNVEDNFITYAKGVETALQEAENGDKAATQLLLNAMFATHRWLNGKFPFFYTPQLFRFSAGYDLTLSMVPPQRMGGGMTMGLVEPVFSGTYHPGFNMCVFAPGRKYVTFNFGLRAKYLARVENINQLFAQFD
ncbi:MAG: hypothetical protein L3J13_01205 [Devosiaceae bacterium]|nr:hypothetical protein [Devosiaceae bacterium]